MKRKSKIDRDQIKIDAFNYLKKMASDPTLPATDKFVARMRYAMEVKGIRNKDVIDAAKLRGVYLSSSTMSQYLGGVYAPKQDRLLLLAEIINVPPMWLMGLMPLEDMDIESQGMKENQQDNQMLKEFRKLNTLGRDIGIQLIRSLTAIPDCLLKQNQEKANTDVENTPTENTPESK